ncbi:MAG: type II toxin-antitoxin system RelE/ParE family toxin [Nitrospirota bacterium]
MIANFADATTRDIFDGINSKAARKIPRTLWAVTARKLDMVNTAHELMDLASPPGNRLELLKGEWTGFHSIRVNDQYRIVFRWSAGQAHDVQITDYH